MNKIVLSIAGVVFLLGFLLRIFFALFFPDTFAEGARKVLFIEEREEDLFRTTKKLVDANRENGNRSLQAEQHDKGQD